MIPRPHSLRPAVLFPVLVLGLVLALAGPLRAAAAAAPPGDPGSDDLRAMLEVLRSDVNGFKVRTLNETLALTGPEAEKFWPIYRQYEKDLAQFGDRRVALIREFASLRQAGALDSAAWESLTRKWLANAQERLDLWKRYQRRVSRSVSPMRAAQFLQVEHQIALFTDLAIASEMPVLGPTSR